MLVTLSIIIALVIYFTGVYCGIKFSANQMKKILDERTAIIQCFFEDNIKIVKKQKRSN